MSNVAVMLFLQAIKEYHGPRNMSPRANLYMFLLYEQNVLDMEDIPHEMSQKLFNRQWGETFKLGELTQNIFKGNNDLPSITQSCLPSITQSHVYPHLPRVIFTINSHQNLFTLNYPRVIFTLNYP